MNVLFGAKAKLIRAQFIVGQPQADEKKSRQCFPFQERGDALQEVDE